MKYSIVIMALLGSASAFKLNRGDHDERAGTSSMPLPFAAVGAMAKPTKPFVIPKNHDDEGALSTSASDATAYHTGSGLAPPYYKGTTEETIHAKHEEEKETKKSKVAGGEDAATTTTKTADEEKEDKEDKDADEVRAKNAAKKVVKKTKADKAEKEDAEEEVKTTKKAKKAATEDAEEEEKTEKKTTKKAATEDAEEEVKTPKKAKKAATEDADEKTLVQVKVKDPCEEAIDVSQHNLDVQLDYYSRRLDRKYYTQAMQIYAEMKDQGLSPKMDIHTWQLYDKAFSFPRVRRYEMVQKHMDLLEHFQDNLNQNFSNMLHVENFEKIAKEAREAISEKYHDGEFSDPADFDPEEDHDVTWASVKL